MCQMFEGVLERTRFAFVPSDMLNLTKSRAREAPRDVKDTDQWWVRVITYVCRPQIPFTLRTKLDSNSRNVDVGLCLGDCCGPLLGRSGTGHVENSDVSFRGLCRRDSSAMAITYDGIKWRNDSHITKRDQIKHAHQSWRHCYQQLFDTTLERTMTLMSLVLLARASDRRASTPAGWHQTQGYCRELTNISLPTEETCWLGFELVVPNWPKYSSYVHVPVNGTARSFQLARVLSQQSEQVVVDKGKLW